MERIEDHIDDALIDLGAVSVETKGPRDGQVEFGGHQPLTGIADD
jgi:hypothetical protein